MRCIGMCPAYWRGARGRTQPKPRVRTVAFGDDSPNALLAATIAFHGWFDWKRRCSLFLIAVQIFVVNVTVCDGRSNLAPLFISPSIKVGGICEMLLACIKRSDVTSM